MKNVFWNDTFPETVKSTYPIAYLANSVTFSILKWPTVGNILNSNWNDIIFRNSYFVHIIHIYIKFF